MNLAPLVLAPIPFLILAGFVILLVLFRTGYSFGKAVLGAGAWLLMVAVLMTAYPGVFEALFHSYHLFGM